MHDNNILIIGVFFLLTSWQPVWGQNQSLYVVENSGAQTTYQLNNIGKLHFAEGQLLIQQYNGSESNYNLTDLRLLGFDDLVDVPFAETDQLNQLKLFPNPASHTIRLDYYSRQTEKATLSLITLDGRQVYRQSIVCKKGSNSISIGLADLPAGLLICRILGSSSVVSEKFIKQ